VNIVTILLMIAGLGAFAAGAMLAATGGRALGIGLMAIGIGLQVLTLARLKKYKRKGSYDARR